MWSESGCLRGRPWLGGWEIGGGLFCWPPRCSKRGEGWRWGVAASALDGRGMYGPLGVNANRRWRGPNRDSGRIRGQKRAETRSDLETGGCWVQTDARASGHFHFGQQGHLSDPIASPFAALRCTASLPRSASRALSKTRRRRRRRDSLCNADPSIDFYAMPCDAMRCYP